MLAAFFESVKYVGHLVPLSFLRVFLGYTYLQMALIKFNSDYLTRPRLAGEIAEVLPTLQAPFWYKNLIETLFIPHWQTFAFIIMGLEFAIAISYLLGYVVRPVAILAALLALNQLVLLGPQYDELSRLLIAIHLLLAWIGAGRCLGFDYYFFKRRRGIWW
mgnify:CR=1 FL=1